MRGRPFFSFPSDSEVVGAEEQIELRLGDDAKRDPHLVSSHLLNLK